MVAVTAPTAGGAKGSGAGSGFGPGSTAAVSGATGGLTNNSSAADLGLFVLLVLSVLFALVADARAIEDAVTAEIGVMKIAKASRQATRTCSLRDEGSGENCFTTRFISRVCGIY